MWVSPHAFSRSCSDGSSCHEDFVVWWPSDQTHHSKSCGDGKARAAWALQAICWPPDFRSVPACLFGILAGWIIIMPRRLCSRVAIKHAINPIVSNVLGLNICRNFEYGIPGFGGMPVSGKAITPSSTAANSRGHTEIKNLVFGWIRPEKVVTITSWR